MLRRIAFLSAAAAVCSALSVSAMAANGGVVGNVVDAGENIVNDVVRAGENVVDDVTDAVTGDNDNNADGNTDTDSETLDIPDEVPDVTEEADTEEMGDIITDNSAQNPSTGIPFAYGAVAALALGGAGMALTFRRDD